MARFTYRVRDTAQQQYQGIVEADSETAAAELLAAEGYVVVWVRLAAAVSWWQRPLSLQRVTSKDRVMLSRQLATLVSSSLPLVEALETLGKQSTKERLRQVCLTVAQAVEGGKRLSEGLALHPEVFSDFYVQLVATGEQVGKLDEVLEYLADEEERRYDLQVRIRNMLIYPAFVLVVLFGMVIFMLAFVMPRMLAILAETNVELPWTTTALIAVSGFFQHWWWAVVISIAVAVVGILAIIRTPRGRIGWSTLQLHLPMVKMIVSNLSIVRLTNSLAILMQGGVDLVAALKTVSGVLHNEVYRQLMRQAAQQVEDGNTLADTLAASRYVPTMVTEMIRVGERVGRLEKTLQRIAQFYGREVQQAVAGLVSLIEPLVIVVIGIGVAIVVSAMILPMYRIVGAF